MKGRSGLQSKFRAKNILVCAARCEAGSRLIIHDEKVASAEMFVHFLDLVLINNVGAVDSTE